MMCTPIQVSKEQAEVLFRKHMVTEAKIYREKKNFWFYKRSLVRLIRGENKIIGSKYSYDDDDNIGFVTLKTSTGKSISYQMRNRQSTPMFVEVGYFEHTRYDIHYPDQVHPEMFEFLKAEGIKVRDKFWEGSQI